MVYFLQLTCPNPIIFASLGNERLAVYSRFLVLRLRVSTQNTVTITTSSLLLNFIRYERQKIRLTHPRVALPYIMYKCNTWVSKSDSLPFIPNKIEQSRGSSVVTVFLCRTRRPGTENNGKRPDARYLGTGKLLRRIWARLV